MKDWRMRLQAPLGTEKTSQLLNSSTSQFLNCSTPELLNSSTPQLLKSSTSQNSSTSQILKSSNPQLLNFSTPELLKFIVPEVESSACENREQASPVTNKTAAHRYARALFDVAVKEQVDLQTLDDHLSAFVELFRQHPALEKVLLNPAVPAPRKRSAMAELVKSADVSPMLAKLLVLLAERDRLVLLPDLLTSYRDRLLEHQHVVRAEVTTALPLAPDRFQAIEQSLVHLTGRSVRLSTRLEPALIGGLVARIGGTVYDGSVTTQLDKMKRRLTESIS